MGVPIVAGGRQGETKDLRERVGRVVDRRAAAPADVSATGVN
jgi:hypothetical protein